MSEGFRTSFERQVPQVIAATEQVIITSKSPLTIVKVEDAELCGERIERQEGTVSKLVTAILVLRFPIPQSFGAKCMGHS